jgi:hypothetical protein
MCVSAHVPGSEPDEAWTFAGAYTVGMHAVDTRGGSRMRESCTYGFVRGAGSNPRPYRDRLPAVMRVQSGNQAIARLDIP